ncbi:MAG: hypothetical protein IJ654_04535 [Bacteroidales bacterium]|nr:hypothetical protein [Bacteroidales bacterium]
MKKLYALLLSLPVVCSAYGRDYHNEWGLTYSQFTVPQFAYVFGGILGVAFSLGNFTFENMIIPGAISLEYTHYANNIFGFGGTLTSDSMTADKYTGKDGDKTYDGKFQMAFLSVMPHVKIGWFDNPHFGMYSKVAAGGAFQLGGGADAGGITFAAQLSPVCMDFGGDSLRGYLELGLGMQGIVSLGIKKRF